MKPWRDIIKRRVRTIEHASVNGRTARWWVSFQTTLTLSCGHKKTFGGEGGPEHKTRCKECPDVGVDQGYAQIQRDSLGREAISDLRAQSSEHGATSSG